jgi:ATP-dependent Zn protease
MIFEKKVNRAMDWLKEQNTDTQVKEEYINDEENTQEYIELESESSIKDEMEKNDIAAIFISAFLMFTPVILLILGFFVLLAYLFF